MNNPATHKKLGKRKCKQCGVVFTKTKPLQFVCSVSCAIDYSKVQEQKKAEKKWKERKKAGLFKLKTYSQRLQEARKVFQEFIRIRDKHQPCISCGTTESSLWDGGHYLKAEVFSGLIFHDDNCHRQCRKCNHFESGNEAAYREGLIHRIGIDRVMALEAIKNDNRIKKWTDEELEEIKKRSKERIKYYKTLYK